MSIVFTQYLPKGKKQLIEIDRAKSVERIALALVKAGFLFTAEVMKSGKVSLRVQTMGQIVDRVLAFEEAENGDGLGAAVDRVIRAAGKRYAFDLKTKN